MSENRSLTVGNWLTIAGLVVALCGMGGGLSLYVYATKSDVVKVQEDCHKNHAKNDTSIQVLETHQKYQTAELQRVTTRLENMDVTQQATARNIERLLERFRVRAEETPALKPVPAATAAPSQ